MRLSHLTRTIAVCAALACGAAFSAQAQTTAAPAVAPTTKPATPGLTAPATPSTPAATSAKQAAAKVNINTATATELDTLPHIGDKRSAAIIKGRPYKSTEELVSKKVLSKSVFDGIKKHITI
jgi:DNA uptake protein ComE-like DNA-binding protein